MKSKLLLLRPVNQEKNSPSKILDKDLNKVKSYDAGYHFHFYQLEYDNFHDAMESVFKQETMFLVLGKLTEYGQELFENEEPGPRRKKKGKPTIQDRDGSEIVLDIDDHIIKDFDAQKPLKGIKKWLREHKIDCDVTWQITSSQKLNTEEARIRLYFECDNEYSLLERKAWSQSPVIMADGSVYTCSQPIFTPAPIIQGGKDPIKQRTGFIKGKQSIFKLPKQSKEDIETYAGNNVAGVVYDYDDPDLPPEVLSGEVYRRYFMPLSFHYVNLLKGDRAAVLAIITEKAMQVKSREFNEENVLAYIDDAIYKLKQEKEAGLEGSEVIGLGDIEVKESEKVPRFPKDMMRNWPEPWPMIWENFKRIPRELTEELLVPTILSTNAYFLQSNFITGMHRRPNMFFLNLAPSTGNKDVNSKNVIEDLDTLFRRFNGAKNKTTPFTGIINGESTITADISFLQSFDEEENLFWVNTEATRIFQQLAQSGNSNVSALADKLIEVVDGRKIGGKKKMKGGSQQILDPCCQVLFYAQPETIEKYITAETVDSGLFGRTMISIIPTLKFDRKNIKLFGRDGVDEKEIDEKFYMFYMDSAMLFSKTDDKTILSPNATGISLLEKWADAILYDRIEQDPDLEKVLKRMGIAAEQLYTVILGICRAYDTHMKVEPREHINVSCMFPLLEYWTDTKIFAIKNYVTTSLEPLADEIHDILQECIGGKHDKTFKPDDLEILKSRYLVSAGIIVKIIKRRTRNNKYFRDRNKGKEVSQEILNVIEVQVKLGILIKSTVKAKGYIGIAK